MHDLAAADAASHGDGAVRVPDAGDPVVQAVLAADASEIDAPGRFDAGYRHPDGEVADPDGALEALQVAEDDVAAHRDHVASAVAHRLEAFRVLQPERRGQRLPHEGYGKLRGSDDESFPCPLQTSQHGQIGAEIVAGGCLDVAVTELSCDH